MLSQPDTKFSWYSIDRQLFEKIAMKTNPTDVQRLSMVNRKIRNWCDQDFYKRMLIHYFNEESSPDPKSCFISKLYGKAWSFGSNEFGQRGIKTRDPIPHLIPIEKNIIAISCGGEHSMILDSEGKVWSFGRNTSGQLGLGHFKDQKEPQLITFAGRVTAISCGNAHSMILDSEGKVWSFGWNADGQLGIGQHDSEGRGFGCNDDQNTPQLISIKRKIVAISCGMTHSMILDSEGQVYSFGSNNFGRLGLDIDHLQKRTVPERIPFEGRVTAIACGADHSAILDSKGRVWSFGCNEYGQLGLGGDYLSRKNPQMISFRGIAIAISCGEAHSMILDSEGQVWSFGHNYNGQLGFGGYNYNQNAPRMIEFQRKAIAIHCYNRQSMILDSEGRVWSFGLNNKGQLGRGYNNENQNTPQMISFEERVIAFSTGNRHSMILSKPL